MDADKLSTLTITEYNLIANKNPVGSYDKSTREHLYSIIEKLRMEATRLTPLEFKIYSKFRDARFTALEEKDKRVKLEVARYRLSDRMQRWLKGVSLAILSVTSVGLFVYEFVLTTSAQRSVDVAWYAGLNRMGLVSKEEMDRMRVDLSVSEKNLQKTKRDYEELARTLDQMILNNRITENLKYILKQVHNDKRTRYKKKNGQVILDFAGRELARYDQDASKWYLLGIVESGVMQVFYNDDQILEIEAIFGRAGEETPLGEYEIKNKVYKPTWYKKEKIDGRVRVRAIPFGDPDHEIGHWWMGMKRLGPPVPGSYGIHGVNVSKVNEFFKKNFDWRNGSAGCPNIQDWYLNFLAKVVPTGTRVNIVAKDKWTRNPSQQGQLVGSL